jgi:hypothetical protein
MACQGKQILADDRHFMKRKESEGMRPEDLNKLLRSESESVEWKRSLGEWKEIVIRSDQRIASPYGETRTCPYGKSRIDRPAWRRSELLV